MSWFTYKFKNIEFHWQGWLIAKITYLSNDGKKTYITGKCARKDFSIPVYPLHVLTTTRICDTLISRHHMNNSPWIRAHTDLYNIRSVSGLMIGFIPYCTKSMN